MANVLQTEQLAPASRVRTAILGAALAALALVGGLLLSFKVGSLANEFLEGRVPRQYVIPLTTLAASTVMLSGSAFWAIGMARLARVPATWRVVASGILGFVPITIVVDRQGNVYFQAGPHQFFDGDVVALCAAMQ